MVNFAAADVDGLVRIIKRKLKKIQYRPHLIDGCLTATGLRIRAPRWIRCTGIPRIGHQARIRHHNSRPQAA